MIYYIISDNAHRQERVTVRVSEPMRQRICSQNSNAGGWGRGGQVDAGNDQLYLVDAYFLVHLVAVASNLDLLFLYSSAIVARRGVSNKVKHTYTQMRVVSQIVDQRMIDWLTDWWMMDGKHTKVRIDEDHVLDIIQDCLWCWWFACGIARDNHQRKSIISTRTNDARTVESGMQQHTVDHLLLRAPVVGEGLKAHISVLVNIGVVDLRGEHNLLTTRATTAVTKAETINHNQSQSITINGLEE
jgi:hypothetical protein